MGCRGKNQRSVNWKWRASLTVEAAFLVPLTVLAVGLILSLGIFLYERTWYTEAACEAVLSGTNRGVLNNRSALDLASLRFQTLETEAPMLPENYAGNVTGDDDTIKVSLEGKTPVWGRDGFSIQVEVSGQTVRPVKLLRQLAALRELVNEVT